MRTMVLAVLMAACGTTDAPRTDVTVEEVHAQEHEDCCTLYPDNDAVVACLSANLPHGVCGRAHACVEGGTDLAVCGD